MDVFPPPPPHPLDQAHQGVFEAGHPPGRAAHPGPHSPADGAHGAHQRLGPAAGLHPAARQGGELRGAQGAQAGHQGGAQGGRRFLSRVAPPRAGGRQCCTPTPD